MFLGIRFTTLDAFLGLGGKIHPRFRLGFLFGKMSILLPIGALPTPCKECTIHPGILRMRSQSI